MQDLYPSIELSNRLESCDKVLFVALFSLNQERQLTSDHNFIEPRNQESEVVTTADNFGVLVSQECIQSWDMSILCVVKAELAFMVSAPAVHLVIRGEQSGVALS